MYGVSLSLSLRADFLDIGVESYLHKIPDNLSSEHAAPLQCAGSTVYSALIDSAKPGDRVGIIGIGGLGHLAIQFSAKMGFETVVFSTLQTRKLRPDLLELLNSIS